MLYLNLRSTIRLIVVIIFLGSPGFAPAVQAQELSLPSASVSEQLVHLSLAFEPPVLRGLKVHPHNPFRLDFVLDKGESNPSNDVLKDESTKLIKYFLASITTPDKDLWVNLSPYEKHRIVPESFGQTELGRDLLAQDYMLKQVTASLLFPENDIGQQFWKRVYVEAGKKYKTTNLAVQAYSKVWIVPEKAVVYENAAMGTAFVTKSKLKVMLEKDYLAADRNRNKEHGPDKIVREIILPALTKEVNEGRNFAKLRQMYSSHILATWYKKKIKDSILALVYADKNKVAGAGIMDPQEKQKIYEQYLATFKRGAYNYIKEEVDPLTHKIIPRKYFSGGLKLALDPQKAMIVRPATLQSPLQAEGLVEIHTDLAMIHRVVLEAAGDEKSVSVEGGRLLALPSDRAVVSTKQNVTAILEKLLGKPDLATARLVRLEEFRLLQSHVRRHDDGSMWIHLHVAMKDPFKEEGEIQLHGLLFPLLLNGDQFTVGSAWAEYGGWLREFINLNTAIPEANVAWLRQEAARIINAHQDVERLKQEYVREPEKFASNALGFSVTAGEEGLMEMLQQELRSSPHGLYTQRSSGITFSRHWRMDKDENIVVEPRPPLEEALSMLTAWQDFLNFPNGRRIRQHLKGVSQLAKISKELQDYIASGEFSNDVWAQIQPRTLRRPPLIRFDKSRVDYLAKLLQDSAMAPGGIDFQPGKMNFELQNSGREIKFKADPALLAEWSNAAGVTPLIINIQPLHDLRGFLGLIPAQDQPQVAGL